MGVKMDSMNLRVLRALCGALNPATQHRGYVYMQLPLVMACDKLYFTDCRDKNKQLWRLQ